MFGANSLLITTPDQLRAGTLTTHDLAVWGHKSIYLPCGPPLSCAICWHDEGMKSKSTERYKRRNFSTGPRCRSGAGCGRGPMAHRITNRPGGTGKQVLHRLISGPPVMDNVSLSPSLPPSLSLFFFLCLSLSLSLSLSLALSLSLVQHAHRRCRTRRLHQRPALARHLNLTERELFSSARRLCRAINAPADSHQQHIHNTREVRAFTVTSPRHGDIGWQR